MLLILITNITALCISVSIAQYKVKTSTATSCSQQLAKIAAQQSSWKQRKADDVMRILILNEEQFA